MTSDFRQDPGDAFCQLWDHHQRSWTIGKIEEWTASPRFKEMEDELANAIITQGSIPDAAIREIGEDAYHAFLLAAAINRALYAIHPRYRRRDISTRLDWLRDRYHQSGRLNSDEVEGALLFRLVQTDRVGPGRADWIADWFTNLRRLSDEQWEDLDLVSLLIDRDFVRDVRERNRKLRVGCLALVEDLDAFDITVRDTFNLATEQKALRYRIGLKAGAITKDLIMKAVHALDAALVDIALLPESTLDDRVCQLWIDVVRTHRPDPGNPLRWIVAGTGHMADGLRRRNTAVVIHRQSGIELARQDKTARYTIPQGTATKWGMDTLTGADEYWEDIEPGTTVVGLESEAGRIAVVICESLSRPVPETDRLHRLGVTHILVPVLDRELGDDRWEVHYSRERVRDIGCSIVIANSLAIARRRQARLIEGAPPPGSIVCSMSRTSTSSYQLKTAEGCLDVQIHEV